jgi:hypothetical protein
MNRWVLLAVSLISGPASAADAIAPPLEPPAVNESWGSPVDAVGEEVEKIKTEAELERERRLALVNAMNEGKAARVVVLEWENEETDYTSDTLVRNVKTRIARPDAEFYPEVDLYQAGRKEPDNSVRPIDQRANVPASAIPKVLAAVEDISTVPWNGMSESDWGLKAHELREIADEIWFIDRPELREPIFMLYVQIGRAAENTNNPSPPFYEQLGHLTVNWYWYLAGAMAHEEPSLMSKLTDQGLYASVDQYKQKLDKGEIVDQTLSFENEGYWDASEFASEYTVYINGLEVVIADKDSLYKAAPGRVDVYLKRDDGHSLSDAIDILKLQEQIYFVRDVARKKMGIDFLEQLMKHPNECSPELDGDILNYLSIYAKLHPEAEVYVAIPEGGNPNKVLLWRWDRVKAILVKVQDNTGGFPVRFVMLFSVGATFNGLGVEVEQPEIDPNNPSAVPEPTATPSLAPAGVPLMGQLRGHYGRLLMLTGVDFVFSLNDKWQDNYQTGGGVAYESPTSATEKLKEVTFSREIYGGIGLVLGKDAAIGFGPRGYLRVGGVTVPHVLDMTAHLGLTANPLGTGQGRVRPVVDVDFFGGAMLPMKTSVFEDAGPQLNLGLSAGIGLTF